MKKSRPLTPSAELFKFCRSIAEVRVGEKRISDGEIGRIIGFENARTSRWKHGTIQVDSAAKLLRLSEELDVDITLLARTAAGLLGADEALRIFRQPAAFLEFLTESLKLPSDGMGVEIISSPGGHARLKKQGYRHYQRHTAPELPDRRPAGAPKAAALLVDDDEATSRIFKSLAAGRPGLRIAVVGSAIEGLIEAGRMQPDLIIFELFLPGADGFASIRALKRAPSTRSAHLVAVAGSLTSDLASQALGAGADEALSRPLNQRQIGRLLARIT